MPYVSFELKGGGLIHIRSDSVIRVKPESSTSCRLFQFDDKEGLLVAVKAVDAVTRLEAAEAGRSWPVSETRIIRKPAPNALPDSPS